MTPRMSVRARAREIYGEMAQGQAAKQKPAPPHPSPLPHSSPDGERPLAFGEREQEDLTSRIRALYETSAVPVREIARIAGVTERTLYKYVAKGGWKRRYACLARDTAVAAANRGRRWQVAPGRDTDIAPAKGAGGRFIRREDIGKPFATGLKALDPAGRGRALAKCRKAKRLSRAAQAKAEKEARAEALIRALDSNARAFAELRRHRESTVKGRPLLPLQLRVEAMLIDLAQWSVRRLETFLPPAPATPPPAAPPPRYDPDDFRAWLPRAG